MHIYVPECYHNWPVLSVNYSGLVEAVYKMFMQLANALINNTMTA